MKQKIDKKWIVTITTIAFAISLLLSLISELIIPNVFIVISIILVLVFIFLGIANGITTLGLSYMPLAVRYMLVGLLCNFLSGWATDFTTKMVMKQQGIELSNELKEA